MNIKLSDFFLIILFAFVTAISFLINNMYLYVLLGLFVFGAFLYKINQSPNNILSLFFLVYHPITLTFGQTGIPYLGALSIILIYVLVIIRQIRNNRAQNISSLHLHKNDIIIVIMVIILLIKWFMSGFSEDGFQHIYQFIFLGLIPYITLTFINIDSKTLNKNIEFSQKVYISYLLAFLILYMFSSDFIERMSIIENPIGISFFFISNAILSLKYFHTNKIYVSIILCLSLFLILYLGQRSFVLAILLCAFIVFIRSKLSNLKKTVIILLLTCICARVLIQLPEDLGYKLNYLTEFITNFSTYIDSIHGFDANLDSKIGTIGTRLFLWYTAVVETNFFYGKPLGSYMSLTGYSYPHNIILEFYYIFGIIGLLGILHFLFRNIQICISKQVKYYNTAYIPLIILTLIVILNFSSCISGSFINLLMYCKILNIYIKSNHENSSNNQ